MNRWNEESYFLVLKYNTAHSFVCEICGYTFNIAVGSNRDYEEEGRIRMHDHLLSWHKYVIMEKHNHPDTTLEPAENEQPKVTAAKNNSKQKKHWSSNIEGLSCDDEIV